MNSVRQPKKVVLMNGPPGCGKDTIASHLVPYFAFQKMKFAAPIKRMAAALLDMDVSSIEKHKENEFNILCKETLKDGLYNETPEYGPKDTLRRFLIRLSEDFLKPLYGDTYFGRIAARELQRSSNSLIIFTDSGFAKEAAAVVRSVGPSNTLLIRLHRDLCDFKGDSRSYLSGIAEREVDIVNSGTISDAVMRVAATIRGTFGIELLKELEF
jgi:hypothetical protein